MFCHPGVLLEVSGRLILCSHVVLLKNSSILSDYKAVVVFMGRTKDVQAGGDITYCYGFKVAKGAG